MMRRKKKGSKKKAAVVQQAAAPSARPPASNAKAGKGKGGKRRAAAKPQTLPKGKPKPVLRPSKSAVVTITVPTGGKITLRDLGIGTVRVKQAVTGGLLLEVPGQDGAQRADKLAESMRAVLAEKGVTVSRPVMCAELRISGLEDSITPAEVISASPRGRMSRKGG